MTVTAVTDLPTILTVPEAGRLLRIGRSKAYELARTPGGLDGVFRIGSSVRVERDVLLAAIRARSVSSAE